jgi:hypothetical protein
VTNTSIQATGSHERSWRVDKIPWSEHNPEAFAGLHNQGRRLIVFFDEASAIANSIWEVAEGALTDEYTQIVFLVFGNPTRTTGYFHECFGRNRAVWHGVHLDAREIEGTNKEQIARWEQQYGEDSDFFRVRVRGQFPRMSDLQFIPNDTVRAAQLREATSRPSDPFIMGVDVARGGSNESVIAFRKGFDARTQRWIKYRGRHTEDLKQLSGRVLAEAERYKPDMIFVDGDGVGAGVYEDIRDHGYPVTECRSGRAAVDDRYANKRAEMWAEMRSWLERGGAIDDMDHQLATDLCGPEYHFMRKSNAICLTAKDDMERLLGLASPDSADALALTFYQPVEQRPWAGGPDAPTQHKVGYDPLYGPPEQTVREVVTTIPPASRVRMED